MTEQMYYIWSWEHNAWWAPKSQGYVEKIKNAGAYSFDEAFKICTGANYGFNIGSDKMPNEGMVPIVSAKKEEEDEEIIEITVDQALALLPKGKEVHTFRDGGFMLVGADWSRKKIEQYIKDSDKREIGGPGCMNMGHGLVITPKGATRHGDRLFVKHDEEKMKKYL